MQSSVVQTSTCKITRASHVQLAHKTQPGMMHRVGIQSVMQSSALNTSTCTVMPASHVQLAQTTQPETMPRERTQRAKPSNVQQPTVLSHMLARSAWLGR